MQYFLIKYPFAIGKEIAAEAENDLDARIRFGEVAQIMEISKAEYDKHENQLAIKN